MPNLSTIPINNNLLIAKKHHNGFQKTKESKWEHLPSDIVFYISQFMGLKYFLLFTEVSTTFFAMRNGLEKYGVNTRLFERKSIKKMLLHPKLSTEIPIKKLSLLYKRHGGVEFKHFIANILETKKIKTSDEGFWAKIKQNLYFYDTVDQQEEGLKSTIKNLKTRGYFTCDTMHLCEALLDGLPTEDAVKIAQIMTKYPISYQSVSQIRHLSMEAIDKIIQNGGSVIWQNICHHKTSIKEAAIVLGLLGLLAGLNVYNYKCMEPFLQSSDMIREIYISPYY